MILEDTDNDRQFDKRKVFWDKGRNLTGMAVGHGGGWIGKSPEHSFIPDRDGNDVPDSEHVVMLDGFVHSTNNVLNNCHWGTGGWLHGAIGVDNLSHVGRPGTPKEQRFEMSRGMCRFRLVLSRDWMVLRRMALIREKATISLCGPFRINSAAAFQRVFLTKL
ncbi:MAG: hypothetical protein ACI93T_000180 [Porticoccaceae bacterium]